MRNEMEVANVPANQQNATSSALMASQTTTSSASRRSADDGLRRWYRRRQCRLQIDVQQAIASDPTLWPARVKYWAEASSRGFFSFFPVFIGNEENAGARTTCPIVTFAKKVIVNSRNANVARRRRLTMSRHTVTVATPSLVSFSFVVFV